MNSLQVRSDEHRVGLRLQRQSRVQGALGVLGLAAASLLMAPKLTILLAGSLDLLGIGFVANLALVFGSLMFLRNAQQMRRQATSQLRSNEEL